jgi:hypothetical protein
MNLTNIHTYLCWNNGVSDQRGTELFSVVNEDVGKK